MNGLFLGLTTLDSIYLADAPPGANQKITADDFTVAAGGPASNAAVAFVHLGGDARLVTALGAHRVAGLIADDLAAHGVELCDLDPDNPTPPPLSSIVVSRASGERAVVSRNAAGRVLGAERFDPALLDGVDLLLADGHQMALAAAASARRGERLLVVDAGSWKPGFESVLGGADYVLCSADFRPPGCDSEPQVFGWLRDAGVRHAAISHGGDPVSWYGPDGSGEVVVPTVDVVDTLGAGDFLHGAFCRYCVEHDFPRALELACAVASRSVTRFGTRAWLERAQEVPGRSRRAG